AKVVRGVARGVYSLDTPALAGNPIAVPQRHIGNKVPVTPLLDRGLAALASGMRAETPGRSTSRGLERRGRGRVVAMGVGDQDMGDPLAREAGEQSLDVLGEIGAGVDHPDLAAADNVGSSAAE